MGRASQIFWYLNMEPHPTKLEKAMIFTHLNITEELKSERRRFRRQLRENSKVDYMKQRANYGY